MQGQIDRGLQLCAACGKFGVHAFCGHCGRRYHGHELERRRCPDCKVDVVGLEFCPHCGEQLTSEFLRRWERGEVDLPTEGRRAKAVLDRMIKSTPSLAAMLYPDRPDLHPAGVTPDIVRVINARFCRFTPPRTATAERK